MTLTVEHRTDIQQLNGATRQPGGGTATASERRNTYWRQRVHDFFGVQLVVCASFLLFDIIGCIICRLDRVFFHSVFEGLELCMEDF